MRGGKVTAVAILDQYLADVGTQNPDLRLSASVLRRRITDGFAERGAIEIREPAFVGREQEMKTLVTRLLAARRRDGEACLIEGDAGIGKSRLASELMKYAVLEGVQAIRTSCRRSDLDRPLSAFVDLVPQLSGLRGALGCSQETLSILRRLTEFGGRVSANANSIDDSSSVYAKVRAALFDLIDAIADEQPLLIVIDDVQWLDQSSVRLFSELLLWIKNRKIFFVLTKRSSAIGASSHAWQEDLKTITLLPLQAQFAEAMIAELLRGGSRPTSPLLVQRLLSVGEGNPLFLQELSNHWLETGQQTGFPPSVTAIVDDRLARLSQEALQVLQACAILGVNASIERVEGVLEFKPHLLLSAVQELSAAGMLGTGDTTSADSSLQLRVRHDLIATAAVRRLATAALSFLHRRAGIVLEHENLGDGTRTAILWACAFHWRHAGERERAFVAARSCAEHLLEVGLPHDAVQAFERALEYCVTDEQRVLVLSRLAVSLQMNGQWEKSKHLLKHLRQLQAKGSPNGTAHDEDEYALFEARWRVSLENSDLLGDLKACVGNPKASVAHRVACGLLGLKVATELSQADAMKDLFLIMEPLLDDPIIPAATRLEVKMVYHASCGNIQEAEQAAEQLLAVVRGERNPLVFSRALGNVAVAYRLVGRKNDAESLFLEVLEHSLVHGLVSRTSFATLSLIRVYLAAGDISKARSAMKKLEAVTDGDQDLHRAADCLYLRARLAFEEGNFAEAAQHYSVLADQSSPSESVNRRAAVLGLGVRIGIEQGAYEKSRIRMAGF
jgi:tetratricopeptide (TPR) repeat protein